METEINKNDLVKHNLRPQSESWIITSLSNKKHVSMLNIKDVYENVIN